MKSDAIQHEYLSKQKKITHDFFGRKNLFTSAGANNQNLKTQGIFQCDKLFARNFKLTSSFKINRINLEKKFTVFNATPMKWNHIESFHNKY